MNTAREQLLLDVLQLSKQSHLPQLELHLEKLLERYRIQKKKSHPSPSHTARHALLKELCQGVKANLTKDQIRLCLDDFRMQYKTKAPNEKCVFKRMLDPEPVAGGPRKKLSTRGECPKCKSQGVVMAHSNSGEDYFSCIYCGYQAFSKSQIRDLDMVLSLELMGRRFDEEPKEQGEGAS